MSTYSVPFDLDQPVVERRRAAPSERSMHRRPGHPYPRESATGSTISCTNSESQISDYITPGLLVFDDLDSVQGGSEGRRKGKQREVLKVEPHTPDERAALDWMRSKLEMDMITVKGWLPSTTDEERLVIEMYLREVVAQANQKYHCNIIFTDPLATSLIQSLSSCRSKLVESFKPFALQYNIKPPDDSQLSASARQEYMKERRSVLFDSTKEGLFTNFLHGHKITGDTVDLLMFDNENLIEGHIQKWYKDTKSPLCDETFRRSLTTTPVMLLSWSAVGLRVAIDKVVEPRSARFSRKKYASWHSDIIRDMERTSAHPVHGTQFKSRLCKLHLRGMEEMTKFLQDNKAARVVYIPSLPSEMSQSLDLFRSKLNHPISQSSTAPAPLPVRSAGAEPHSEIPSHFSQTHTFAGGSESLLMPPFADTDNSLTGPSYYSQPIASSQYLGHEMRFDVAGSTHQLGMRQENYNPPLPVPSQSQEGDNRSYHLQY
ncbi:uncharacterized protein F5891DRAFT_1184657 [Suillus fuscotomentosus]|uniref:DUF6532 domain-containing protein n=1 Tax=Suillus fuscotomentosus TaxID=1912939 RepID=A0AAD4EEA3_9AGAM|nr:uncharacterized protein F5891DRAFT_1184657 [Suillus fuscotomentosus]KAG1904442.1 hypothetical protein F5891DRAFT_1184657 [Suillus fuscotomentosus]